MLGDSGGNQPGMERVAAALNRRWSGEKARVHLLREYYFEDRWSYDSLKKFGITQIDKTPPPGEPQDRRTDWRNGIHDDIYYEAQIAVQDPKLIRMEQRIKAGLFSLHGVELAPIEKTIEIGRKLAAYRAEITARALEASKRKLREELPESGDISDSCVARPVGSVVLRSEKKPRPSAQRGRPTRLETDLRTRSAFERLGRPNATRNLELL